MKRVQRYDTARITAHFDTNGFLVDRPIVARIGLQVYHTPDGKERREFRPASEVFKADSLASYQGKPVTLGHVTVNSKNARDVVVGSCSGAGVPQGIGVEVPLVVYDDTAIQKAQQKIAAELSVGYTSVDIEEPGWGCNETGEYILDSQKQDGHDIPYGWVRFDAVQTEIDVNHVAMVFRGRAKVAKLNLDSEQDFPYDAVEINDSTKEDAKMKKIKIDGVELEVQPEVAAHIEALGVQAGKVDSLTGERDQLKAKVDAIPAQVEKAVTEAVENFKADAAALAEVKAVADEAGVKTDGLDVKGIKVAFVKHVSGHDVSDKSDGYIDGAFDSAKGSFDPAAKNRADVDGVPGTQKKNDSDDGGVPDQQNKFRNRKSK